MIAIANRATLTSTRMTDARIAERAFAGLVADLAADDAHDQLARPDRALERGGDDEDDVEQAPDPLAAARRSWRRCRAPRRP